MTMLNEKHASIYMEKTLNEKHETLQGYKLFMNM